MEVNSFKFKYLPKWETIGDISTQTPRHVLDVVLIIKELDDNGIAIPQLCGILGLKALKSRP